MNDDVRNEINTKIRTSTTFAVDTVKVVKVVVVRILVSIPLWTNGISQGEGISRSRSRCKAAPSTH